MGSLSNAGYTPVVQDVKSYGELQALTDEQLVGLVDKTLKAGMQPHLTFYREEIARRDGARREARMLNMTRALMWLTVVIGAVAIISLAIALAAFLR